MSTATFTEAEQAVVAMTNASIRMADLCDEALQALFNNNGNRDDALEDMGFDDASSRDFLDAMDHAMVVHTQRVSKYRRAKRALDSFQEDDEPSAKKSKDDDGIVWILEMQTMSNFKCIVGVFSSEAELDAHATKHDPSINATMGIVHKEDDFFIPYFRKRPAKLNETIQGDGTPIYGSKYETTIAEWTAARTARFAAAAAAAAN